MCTCSGCTALIKPAQTPPMGWNSYDCFGNMVTEEQVKANADYMAEHLHRYGWEYIVIDIQWAAPFTDGPYCAETTQLTLDYYGRLIPAVDRFPSAVNGNGFRPLADYVHSKGLKLGVHIMRGIPRRAVEINAPVAGTNLKASDIADTSSLCDWCPDMYGVNPQAKGSQNYYDSLADLYAEWEIDFIKADDMSWPYHRDEIEMLNRAIHNCGRDIVLSLSPGQAPLEQAEHLKAHANMWRVSADLWDSWEDLYRAFELAEKWVEHAGPNHWPDSDMLPLGRLEVHPFRLHQTRFSWLTRDEQQTLMTLWCIARSPLMFGGNLPDNDEWTLSLITNEEVLKVLKSSHSNKQLFRIDHTVVWTAIGDDCRYLALFNLSDQTADVSVDFSSLGLSTDFYNVRDLWLKQDIGSTTTAVSVNLGPHCSRLFRL